MDTFGSISGMASAVLAEFGFQQPPGAPPPGATKEPAKWQVGAPATIGPNYDARARVDEGADLAMLPVAGDQVLVLEQRGRTVDVWHAGLWRALTVHESEIDPLCPQTLDAVGL